MRTKLPPDAEAQAKRVNLSALTEAPKPRPRRTASKIDPGLVLDAWCDAAGWERPAREFAFAAPVREWRFDFAWPAVKVALELDGAVWTQGRHTRGSGFLGDLEKMNEAAIRGWLVLRVETKRANDEKTRGLIVRAMQVRRAADQEEVFR